MKQALIHGSLYLSCLTLSAATVHAGDVTAAAALEKQPAFEHMRKVGEIRAEITRLENQIISVGSDADRAKLSAEIERLRTSDYAEQREIIRSYSTSAKEQILEQALISSVDNLSLACASKNVIADCESTLITGISLLQKYFKSDSSALVAQSERGVANFFEAKGKFVEAARYYRGAYDYYALFVCSDGHVNLLVKLLNASLKVNNTKDYEQYWKIAQFCESSQKLERKGGKFKVSEATREVTFEVPPRANSAPATRPQPVAPAPAPASANEKVFHDRDQFVAAVTAEIQKLFSGDEALMNQAFAAMGKGDNAAEGQKAANKMKSEFERKRQKEMKDFEALMAKDPDYQRKAISKVRTIKIGASRAAVMEQFGKADGDVPAEATLGYLLYTGGQPLFLEGKFEAPRAPVEFKFDKQGNDGKLIAVTFKLGVLRFVLRD